jgi:hypothetical protein
MKLKKESFSGMDRLIHEENKSGPSAVSDDYMDHGKKNREDNSPGKLQERERRGNK